MVHQDLWQKLTPEEKRKIQEMYEDRNIQRNLTDSLFPAIYG